MMSIFDAWNRNCDFLGLDKHICDVSFIDLYVNADLKTKIGSTYCLNVSIYSDKLFKETRDLNFEVVVQVDLCPFRFHFRVAWDSFYSSTDTV